MSVSSLRMRRTPAFSPDWPGSAPQPSVGQVTRGDVTGPGSGQGNTEISSEIVSCCRFSPGKDWSVNRNLQPALALLRPIKKNYGSSLSMSDLIILAGTTALELGGNILIPFCSVGRVDLNRKDEGWKHLEPRIR